MVWTGLDWTGQDDDLVKWLWWVWALSERIDAGHFWSQTHKSIFVVWSKTALKYQPKRWWYKKDDDDRINVPDAMMKRDKCGRISVENTSNSSYNNNKILRARIWYKECCFCCRYCCSCLSLSWPLPLPLLLLCLNSAAPTNAPF